MNSIFQLLGYGILTGILGYLLCRVILIKRYVSKSDYRSIESELLKLRIDSAAMLTKEEVSTKYIAKELYDLVNSNLKNANDKLSDQQTKIEEAIAESEKKLSKEEISDKYVPKESFELLRTRANSKEDEVEEKNEKILELNNSISELHAENDALNEKMNSFKAELKNIQDISKDQFKNLANDIFEEKRKAFIGENKKELSTIIDPLKTDLNQFKDKIEATRKEDIQDLTSLKGEISLLQKLGIQLSDDAKGLTNALKSDVKIQGTWGEDRLKLILEAEGLQKYVDFKLQERYRDEENDQTRIPDLILNLPNQKHLIIDSKVSLTAYVNYFNAASPEDKAEYLRQHIKSINDHIDYLSDKNYQSLAGITSPDYVFLFMPIDSAITLAINENPDLFNRALNKKIVITTPTTIIATLKVVRLIWQKENQVKNVEEIFKQCGLLHDKFVTFLEEMEKVGLSLQGANRSYREAMDKLKDGAKRGDTIIGRFDAIRRLEARTNKKIPQKFISELDILDSDSGIEINSDKGENPDNGGKISDPENSQGQEQS
ncbi:MAG: DNA recombination protein RmuC [Bacteroidetes bacterium]|nr:MAG: DNA recombination protein RmuC [Bacteroidota bacterium]